MTPQPLKLGGRATTIGGIISLVMGLATVGAHIWALAHGAQFNGQALTTGGGLISAGLVGVSAADANQK